VGKKQGNIRVLEHGLRDPTKYALLEARVIVSAHDDHVGGNIDGVLT
jgi:hypothetical protein